MTIWLQFDLKLYQCEGIDHAFFDQMTHLLQEIDIEYRELSR